MKAERRHELQENALARRLAQAPDFFRQHGGKFVLGALLLILLVVFIFTRINAKRVAVAKAAADLALAEEFLLRIETNPHPTLVKQAEDLVRLALSRTDDPTVRARAYVVKGRFHWAVANAPRSAVPPSVRPDTHLQQHLEQSQIAFQTVVGEFSQDPISLAAAHFGLAAIAENRAYALTEAGDTRQAENHWLTAGQHYNAIMQNVAIPEPLREQAKVRAALLETLKLPPAVADAPPATTQAATTQAQATLPPTTQSP